jgi:hypothetical protein
MALSYSPSARYTEPTFEYAAATSMCSLPRMRVVISRSCAFLLRPFLLRPFLLRPISMSNGPTASGPKWW